MSRCVRPVHIFVTNLSPRPTLSSYSDSFPGHPAPSIRVMSSALKPQSLVPKCCEQETGIQVTSSRIVAPGERQELPHPVDAEQGLDRSNCHYRGGRVSLLQKKYNLYKHSSGKEHVGWASIARAWVHFRLNLHSDWSGYVLRSFSSTLYRVAPYTVPIDGGKRVRFIKLHIGLISPTSYIQTE